MKIPAFITALLLATVSVASAQEVFPGLKSVLSAGEWKRAGLDKLSPDEIGVIDAALIRHQNGATAHLQTELTVARQTAVAVETEHKKGLLQRFGLPVFDDADWRTLPPLRAKVVKWEGGNRFRLDNGQVWEGSETITYDLPGKAIEIQARPMGQFALTVEGVNTTLRVIRLR